MTLFEQKKGYGHGCLWSCHLYGRDIEYRVEDYPNAFWSVQRLTGVMRTKPPNGLGLMRYYVDAFHKVFDNLDVLLANSDEEPKRRRPEAVLHG
jgi:perosamine synthetase